LWFKFRKVCFFSDFCGKDKDDIKLYYQRHYVQGRKDPAQAAIEGTEKKPSHNTVDMICFMKGLQQNLIHGVIETVQLVKCRPNNEGWVWLGQALTQCQHLHTL
jgi:hypothetical protein